MNKTVDKDAVRIMIEAFDEYDNFPNNEFSLLIYKKVFETAPTASDFEGIFRQNNWTNSWRNGVYPYHHYHSTTHEVLGIYSGKATIKFGGPKGISEEVEPGDVIIIPAGVAHKNLNSTEDFACVGAYPDGKRYDMNYGRDGERPQTDKNIAAIDLPKYDPVYGEEGPLTEIWNKRKSSVI